MPLTIDLDEGERRLLRLEVFYMLGHPRWQSDRATAGRREELVAVYRQIRDGVPNVTGPLSVEPQTVALLDSALGRVMPELKTFGMLAAAAAGKRDASMVEGFDAELEELFPATAGDPGKIEDLLPGLMRLRRDFARASRRLAEMEAEQRATDAAATRKPTWRFWRRR